MTSLNKFSELLNDRGWLVLCRKSEMMLNKKGLFSLDGFSME